NIFINPVDAQWASVQEHNDYRLSGRIDSLDQFQLPARKIQTRSTSTLTNSSCRISQNHYHYFGILCSRNCFVNLALFVTRERLGQYFSFRPMFVYNVTSLRVVHLHGTAKQILDTLPYSDRRNSRRTIAILDEALIISVRTNHGHRLEFL